jgi:hypothetical protein
MVDRVFPAPSMARAQFVLIVRLAFRLFAPPTFLVFRPDLSRFATPHRRNPQGAGGRQEVERSDRTRVDGWEDSRR